VLSSIKHLFLQIKAFNLTSNIRCYMRFFFVFLFLFVFTFFSNAQGSGNCANFDGVDDYVAVKNTFPNQTTSFSISAWIFTLNNAKTGQRIFIDDANNAGGYGFSLGEPGVGRLRFYWRLPALFILDASITTEVGLVENSTWYHAVVTVNATTNNVTMYLNGVVVASAAYSGAPTFDVGDASIGGENNASSEIGSAFKFTGRLDEVIYWNKELSQTEVRNIMCAKQSTADADILGYWNFDNANFGIDNVPDIKSGNLFPGTFTNGGISSPFILSGAAIGDASANLYPVNWTGQTLSLGSAGKGLVSVQNVTTNSGIHIYRVNQVPSSTSGLSGLGNNYTYWGIYTANVATANYEEVFNYSTYPDALFAEASLNLFYRQKNDQTNWNNRLASQNIVSHLFATTITNDRQELILVNPAVPLPIELLYFEAKNCDNENCIIWQTASEKNNEKFEVQKSTDGVVFKTIGTVMSKNSNGTSLQSYQFIDENPAPINYYRLKQIDFDRNFSVSEIVLLESTKANGANFIYPVPVKQILRINNASTDLVLELYTIEGKKCFSDTYLLDGISISGLRNGTYYARILKDGSLVNKSIIRIEN
jgi:Concanavalin A-like lectin/glucanases superfamily